jgi:hypothetical protein
LTFPTRVDLGSVGSAPLGKTQQIVNLENLGPVLNPKTP